MATSTIMKYLSNVGIYSTTKADLLTALNVLGAGKSTTCAFSGAFASELTDDKITASFKGIISNLGGGADIFGMDGNGNFYTFRISIANDGSTTLVFIKRATMTAI